MDFAKKQLEKYGWSEGKGLGKKEDGMSDALKPKIKKSFSGLGHNISEEFTNTWWNKVYKNASDNITIKETQNGDVESFSTKDYMEKFKGKKTDNANKDDSKSIKTPLYFQTFVRKAVLTNGVTVNETKEDDDEPEIVNNCERIETKRELPTDDELFNLCGRRTVHKGARHGLKSSGKLSRLEMQERIFLEKQKLNKSLNNEQSSKISKNCKRIKKNEDHDNMYIIHNKRKKK